MLKKLSIVIGSLVMSSSAALADWTGPYVGAQIGYADIGTSAAGVEGDGTIGGITAGYDFDLGSWVAGVGIDYDWSDVDLGGAATVENVFRLKLRAGAKVGDGLAYATAGYANAYTDTLDNSDGYFIGAGYEHSLAGGFNIGAEVLYHEFDDFNGSGIDVDATTIQMRATYRF